MTANMIACISFLSVGILLALFAIYNIIRMFVEEDEEYRIIPVMLSTAVSFICIITPIIHWHDDDEYKTIECSEYKVETITTYSDTETSTTYKIYYK